MYHIHHIIPKHRCKKFNLNPEHRLNTVKLTIKEHALAHKRLYEKHGHGFDNIAYRMLSGQITVAEATKLAQKLRDTSYMKSKSYREKMSRSKMGTPAWNKGLTNAQFHHKGDSHYNTKQCLFQGVKYKSIGEAIKKTGIHRLKLYKLGLTFVS